MNGVQFGRPVQNFDTEFLYRNWGEITRFLNQRKIPINERNEVIQMISMNYDIFKVIRRDMSVKNEDKWQEIINNLIYGDASIVGILGNQRSGKDTLACKILDEVTKRANVRICTYLSWADYPWLDSKDKYFLLEDVPKGTPECPTILYIPELDLAFPARQSMKGDENEVLNTQINIMGQQNIKLIGTAKLGANVDLAFWRHCNMYFFKFIDKQKLLFGERQQFISETHMFMLPRDRYDKTQFLYVFGDTFYSCTYKMSEWFGKSQSNQYANVTQDQVDAYKTLLQEKGFNDAKIGKEIKRLLKR